MYSLLLHSTSLRGSPFSILFFCVSFRFGLTSSSRRRFRFDVKQHYSFAISPSRFCVALKRACTLTLILPRCLDCTSFSFLPFAAFALFVVNDVDLPRNGWSDFLCCKWKLYRIFASWKAYGNGDDSMCWCSLDITGYSGAFFVVFFLGRLMTSNYF